MKKDSLWNTTKKQISNTSGKSQLFTAREIPIFQLVIEETWISLVELLFKRELLKDCRDVRQPIKFQ